MRSRPMRVMLLMMVLVIVIAGVLLGGFYYMKHAAAAPKPAPSPTLLQSEQETLDKLTTNLEGSAVIQVTFVLQGNSVKCKQDLDAMKPQILDAINMILHNTSSTQLSVASGLTTLEKTVQSRVNNMLPTGDSVGSVYINDIIVQ